VRLEFTTLFKFYSMEAMTQVIVIITATIEHHLNIESKAK